MSQRSPALLRAFAEEHLCYRCWMLSALTKRFYAILEHDRGVGRRDLEWLDLETRNAQVESFAIHSRALIDFFYPPANPHDDDVLASHYVAGAWVPPPPKDSLKRVRNRVNKEVAHLTYRRAIVVEEAKNWNYGVIWRDLSDLLLQFLLAADPSFIRPEIRVQLGVLANPTPRDPANSVTATHSTTTASYPGSTRTLPRIDLWSNKM